MILSLKKKKKCMDKRQKSLIDFCVSGGVHQNYPLGPIPLVTADINRSPPTAHMNQVEASLLVLAISPFFYETSRSLHHSLTWDPHSTSEVKLINH